MTSKLIPANPADVMVIRDVTPNIATFSVPFSRLGTAKIGGRGTLVKLTSGNLAVFSPVALTEEAKAKVAEMGGQVNYVVALDYEHHIFISEWVKEYPSAKIIGPEGLPEKRAKSKDPKIGHEEFAFVFRKDNKREIKISDEFDADFKYEYCDGHVNLEFAFFYKPDQTLIVADLLFNLPAIEQYSKVFPESQRKETSILGRILAFFFTPRGGDNVWAKRFAWYFAPKDRECYRDSLVEIDNWDFTRVIPCHGEVLEGNGKEVFRKVFAWYLEGKKNQ